MKIIYKSNRKFFKKKSGEFFLENFCIKKIDKKKIFCSNNILFSFIKEKISIENHQKKFVKRKNWVIDLYKKYGLEYLIKFFDNNYSFLIIDLNKKFLFINNDIFGTSTLYFYKKNNEEIIISNQLKSILDECQNFQINDEFLKKFSFLHYRYIEWKNETPIKNIKKIPLSHYLKVEFNKDFTINNLKLKKWKTFHYKNNFYKKGDTFLKNKILNYLKSSIKSEIIKPKETLFSLSGGLDSSSLVALSQKIFPDIKIHAATITYDDKTYNEKDDVNDFLSSFNKNKIEWHNIKINSKNIDQKIIKYCSDTDYPFHTVTWFVDAIFKKEIKNRGFNYYVSGLGGDQLNAGEYDYFHYFFADLVKENNLDQLNQEVKCWAKNHNHPIFKKNIKKEIDYIKNQIKNEFNFYDSAKVLKYLPYSLKKPKIESFNFFKSNSYLINKTLNEINFEMLPICLISDFNNSNKNKVKNIYPYLNYDHFNTMLSTSNYLKINQGVQKALFREALKGITPQNTLKKIRKTGWNAPSHLWLASKYTNLLNDIFSSKDFRESGLYDTKKIKQLYENHNKIIKKGQMKENHMMFFWQLASINIWKNSIKVN